MFNMIPKVKTWIVTLENGNKVEVWAPTKFLAKLNYRNDYQDYTPIKSVGVKKVAK